MSRRPRWSAGMWISAALLVGVFLGILTWALLGGDSDGWMFFWLGALIAAVLYFRIRHTAEWLAFRNERDGTGRSHPRP